MDADETRVRSAPDRPNPADGVRRVLVSRCINGPPIRYNQTNVEVRSDIWDRWASEGRLVPFCSELEAGFAVPRPPAEILGGDASAVLMGRASVLEGTGGDVTDLFVQGAELAVAHAIEHGCVVAVLTDGSPSCGSTYTYDGSFTGRTLTGMGVTARLLADRGIPVYSENQLEEADEVLRRGN